jgi:hypothetical protein
MAATPANMSGRMSAATAASTGMGGRMPTTGSCLRLRQTRQGCQAQRETDGAKARRNFQRGNLSHRNFSLAHSKRDIASPVPGHPQT